MTTARTETEMSSGHTSTHSSTHSSTHPSVSASASTPAPAPAPAPASTGTGTSTQRTSVTVTLSPETYDYFVKRAAEDDRTLAKYLSRVLSAVRADAIARAEAETKF